MCVTAVYGHKQSRDIAQSDSRSDKNMPIEVDPCRAPADEEITRVQDYLGVVTFCDYRAGQP